MRIDLTMELMRWCQCHTLLLLRRRRMLYLVFVHVVMGMLNGWHIMTRGLLDSHMVRQVHRASSTGFVFYDVTLFFLELGKPCSLV